MNLIRDPKQAAYEAYRAAWRAEVAVMEPYQHPDGSPVTPFVEDPLATRADALEREQIVAAYKNDPETGWS